MITMNKYLEKIAAYYSVDLPHTQASDFVDSKTISLSRKEYDKFKKDTDKNWTGKSIGTHAGTGAVIGGGVGALINHAVNSSNQRSLESAIKNNKLNKVWKPKVLEGMKSRFKGGYGGAITAGALIGAAVGLNSSRERAKARALYKHYPELNKAKNKWVTEKKWYE